MQTVMTLKTLSTCLEYNIMKDIPTFIWGPPGVGKSQTVWQVADRLGYSVIDMRLSLRDPVDLRGLPLVDPVKGTTRWLPPGELPQVKRDGRKGILFLDEANTASMQMQSAAMGLVLDRKLGEYTLPEGWVPVAAGNRMSDKAAAQRMGTALKNRFAHFEIVPDLEAWTTWAAKTGLHPMVIGFVRFRPALLHVMPKGEENSFPTPRAWEKVAKVADAPEAIRLQLVSAIVGEGAGIEFEGFCQIFKDLPSIDQILKAPRTVRCPDASEVAACWAVSQALATRVVRENFAQALDYTERLPKEFQVSMVVDAINREPDLKKTKSYVNWAVANQEVV